MIKNDLMVVMFEVKIEKFEIFKKGDFVWEVGKFF